MYKLWATIKKDTRILLRDKVGLLLMFVMPILLVIIVTGIQNSTFELMDKSRLAMLICNRDTGKLSGQFVESLNRIGMFKLQQVSNKQSDAQLKNLMKTRNELLTVIVPADFTAKVSARAKNISGKALNSFGLQGDTTKTKLDGLPLTLYYQPVLQEQYRVSVNSALKSALQIVQSRETLRRLYFEINEKPLPENLEKELLNGQTNISQQPVSVSGSRKVPNASEHNVPGWTIFAMFFVVISLGGSLVREKVSGSFIRLKTLPTDFTVGLASKMITYLGVTMVQTIVIFAIGLLLFPALHLPKLHLPADLLALVIVTLFCGLCAVSYAICIGIFANTQEQANGIGAVSIVILSAIGGLMVPSFAMPEFFQAIAGISPLHWCLEAYYKLFLEDGTLADVLPNLLPLLVVTVVLLSIAFVGLKRKKLI
ncbi:ABC transporter permease [Mucilaginibacter sp. RS28]|uniref:ABC transporter permease n=1 Tax=Mucilaginibacter straminoryzae TaxID=2932774 RepID=A0A9X1WYT2_9SPHI|nr:ABC transporter permease [Mucilaginibacter straminoryzae]MCJ8208147.1 ABC transporter permease [Mucilaginibacter straminoryzae]